ncbi:exodeoxyribonuclease VII small subunit [Deinococcus hopiensis]|nr:exodeoxyribonuclease VII small subunit [Deinococcus hopiensis]
MTYREAYARLSRIAAELEGGEADLDRVLPLLEEARAAYAACRERIEAVRAVLAGEWAEEEEADAAAPALEQAATDEGDSPF